MRTAISERELVAQVPLADMIDYLGLKRQGRSFQCPNHQAHNHNDRNLSTYIASTDVSWTCHKCNIGGTVVQLIMVAYGLSYENAKLAIADWAGIPVSPIEGRFSQTLVPPPSPAPTVRPTPPPPADPSVGAYLRDAQAAMRDAPLAITYLTYRRIPFAVAVQAGLGFVARGDWPNPRGAAQPRLIAPLTAPDGTLLNLYGRSIIPCEKSHRHDFLMGPKGLFNTPALAGPTVILVEGVFDALSVMAAGYPAAALCGVTIREEWWPLVEAEHIILALDADDTGQQRSTALTQHLARLGKRLATLSADTLIPHKDLNEYWGAHTALPPALLALLAERT